MYTCLTVIYLYYFPLSIMKVLFTIVGPGENVFDFNSRCTCSYLAFYLQAYLAVRTGGWGISCWPGVTGLVTGTTATGRKRSPTVT
jgi:hypothetical protein